MSTIDDPFDLVMRRQLGVSFNGGKSRHVTWYLSPAVDSDLHVQRGWLDEILGWPVEQCYDAIDYTAGHLGLLAAYLIPRIGLRAEAHGCMTSSYWSRDEYDHHPLRQTGTNEVWGCQVDTTCVLGSNDGWSLPSLHVSVPLNEERIWLKRIAAAVEITARPSGRFHDHALRLNDDDHDDEAADAESAA